MGSDAYHRLTADTYEVAQQREDDIAAVLLELAVCRTLQLGLADRVHAAHEVLARRAERKTLADVVRDHILSTYLRHDGDKTATAAELGVCLKTLYNHLRRYGVIKFSPKTTIKNTECV